MAEVAVGADDVPGVALAVLEAAHRVARDAGLVADELPRLGKPQGRRHAGAQCVVEGRAALAGYIGKALHEVGEEELRLAPVRVAVADVFGGGVHTLPHGLGLLGQCLGRLGVAEVDLQHPHRAGVGVGRDGEGGLFYDGAGIFGAVCIHHGLDIRLLVVAHAHGEAAVAAVDGLVELALELCLGGHGLDGGNLLRGAAEGDGDVDFIVRDDAHQVVGHIVHGIGAQGIELGDLIGRLAEIRFHVAVVVGHADGAVGLPLPDKAQNGVFEPQVVLHGDGVGGRGLGGSGGVGREGEIVVVPPGTAAREQAQKRQQWNNQPARHGYPSLQIIFVIAFEAVAQHLVGLLEDDEGAGIHGHDQLLELGHLALFDGAEDHLLVLAGVVALAAENGDAAVELLANFPADILVAVGDDERHGGVVQAVDHAVQDDAANIERDGGVERLVDVAEDHAGEGDGDDVDGEHDPADGEVGKAGAQEPGDDVHAAGGSARDEHQAQSQSGEQAAVEGGQEGLGGGDGNAFKDCQEEVGEKHAQQGAEEELPAHAL